MEFRVSYSEDYLEHHGTKGMKWGIRNYQNKDGTLTEAGRERYRRELATNATKEANKLANMRMIPAMAKETAGRNSWKINHLINEVVQNREERHALEDSKELKTLAEWKSASDSTKNENYAIGSLAEDIWIQAKNGNPRDLTLSDMEQDAFEAIYDDGTQNKFEGINIMAYRSDPSNHDNLVDKAYRYNEVLEEEEKAVFNFIDEYSDVKLNTKWDSNASAIISAAIDKDERTYLSYDVEKFTDEQKKSITTAEKIITSIPAVSQKSNGWWKFDEAIQHLGFDGSERLADLTDADWKKINAEIAKIAN